MNHDHKTSVFLPIGVIHNADRIGLLQIKNISDDSFLIAWSSDGHRFTPDSKKVIFKKGLTLHKPGQCSDFRFSYNEKYLATYLRNFRGKMSLVTAVSVDMYTWNVVAENPYENREMVIVQNSKTYQAYQAGVFVRGLESGDLKKWTDGDEYLLTSRIGKFDAENIILLSSFVTDRGIALVYESTRHEKDGSAVVALGGALFAHDNMRRLIWRSEESLCDVVLRRPRAAGLTSLGAVVLHDRIYAYWRLHDGELVVAETESFGRVAVAPRPDRVTLERHPDNPVLEPHPKNEWEREAVFNPAAVMHDDKVHMLYRAMGPDGISRLGYASSADGYDFETRLPYPVYRPTSGVDVPEKCAAGAYGPMAYSPMIYPSGGGWGGCEDPRAVKIGNRVYVTYVAFEGWDSMRIALTSISANDLAHHRWNWKKPRLISPAKSTSKNWVIFPEKIRGKFAILHGIAPEIMVDYVDSLDTMSVIDSKRPQGTQPGRRSYWDNRLRGAGPPPIKTSAGWLLLYHATDSFDPNKYKLGAMLLDLKNPTKILHRSSQPILTPEMSYENEGKPGIVYASGAIVKDDDLIVYYGGGDRVVCVASIPLQELLDDIIEDKQIALTSHALSPSK